MSALLALFLLATPAQGLPGALLGPVRHPVRVNAPPEVPAARVAALEAACEQVRDALGPLDAPLSLKLRQAGSVEAFATRTGRARFEAAALVEGTVWLQPEPVLSRLADVDSVLRHECVHAWLRAQGLRGLPRALEEALAVGVSGQAARLPPAPKLAVAELAALTRALTLPRDRATFERAVARATATFWPLLQPLEAEARTALLCRIQAAPADGWLDVPLPDGRPVRATLAASTERPDNGHGPRKRPRHGAKAR